MPKVSPSMSNPMNLKDQFAQVLTEKLSTPDGSQLCPPAHIPESSQVGHHPFPSTEILDYPPQCPDNSTNSHAALHPNKSLNVNIPFWQRGAQHLLGKKFAKPVTNHIVTSNDSSVGNKKHSENTSVVFIQMPKPTQSASQEGTIFCPELSSQDDICDIAMGKVENQNNLVNNSTNSAHEDSVSVAGSCISASGRMCRICHCSESDDNSASIEVATPTELVSDCNIQTSPLIAPCLCSGSLKYVHQSCLQQWIKSSDSKRCELCHFQYIMKISTKPFLKWEKLRMTRVERRKIICSVAFHVIALLCVVWSLFVLIERTTDEVSRGILEWPFWTKVIVIAIGFTGGFVFVYVQCRMYLGLCRKWRCHNRTFFIQTLPPDVYLRASQEAKVACGNHITSIAVANTSSSVEAANVTEESQMPAQSGFISSDLNDRPPSCRNVDTPVVKDSIVSIPSSAIV